MNDEPLQCVYGRKPHESDHMPLVLRGGIGDAFGVNAEAYRAYRQEQERQPGIRRPKTRRAMKRKIVRGKRGARARGGFVTLSGIVRDGLHREEN